MLLMYQGGAGGVGRRILGRVWWWLGMHLAFAVSAAEAPRLSAPARQATDWILQWTEGEGPFQIEQAPEVAGPWAPVGSTVEARTLRVPDAGFRQFFRVREVASEVPSGEAAMRATLGGIGSFVASVSREDAAAWKAQVLAHLKSRADIVAAGESGDGVWGITHEGIPLALWNNRPSDPPGLDEVPASLARHGTELPRRTRARLSVTLGNSGFTQCAPRLGRLLSGAGYGTTTDTANLDTLKGVMEAPVFFLNTHGGMFGIPQLKPDLTFVTDASGQVQSDLAYGLWTGTKVDPDRSDPGYNHTEMLREVRAKRLAVALCPISFTRDASGTLTVNEEWHFAITADWVRTYLSFPASSHASVWLGACKSGAAEGAPMRAAFRAVGAEMVSGWTGDTTGAAVLAATSFLYDRLLGANEVLPPATPQRAFNYEDSWTELRSRGLHRHSVPGNPPTLTDIVYEGAAGDTTFGVFAPSLAYVLIDELDERAHLIGLFGTPPAGERKVTIGGEERTVISWEPRKVVVDLPRQGAGSAGDVKVEVRGVSSNVRRLSRWTITGAFRFFEDDSAHVIEGPASFVFRADIGEYRLVPGNVFIRPTRYAVAAQSSDFQLEAKGIDSTPCGENGRTTITWSGGGAVPVVPVGKGAGRHPFFAYVYLAVNSIDLKGAMGFVFGLLDLDQCPFKMTIDDCETGVMTFPVVPASPGELEAPQWFGSPLEERLPDGSALELPLPGKDFVVGVDWGIPAGEMKNDLRASFRWNAAAAEFAPDSRAAR
ncbi:MAG: hypothetical protein IT580_05575 [Verrucomicrobiales bacterium]|nr:hypothetical protein [Verrucomicrobiales bacterium]